MKKHLLVAVCCTAFLNYSFAQSWSLSGNAGTAPSTNFIGTTDNKALVFRTKNIERIRILNNGKIGVGTKNPAAYFHLFGTMQIENNSGTVYDEPLLTLRNSSANGTPTNPAIAFKGEDTLFATVAYDFSTRDFVISARPDILEPNFIINHDNGFVGLNTKTPQARLHVNGNQILDGNLTIGTTGRNVGITFTEDWQNITFATPTTSSYPMIYMSPNGSTNKRMVLARSQEISNTGLQYDFNGDKFNFMKSGASKLFIDLTNGRVGINDATPSYPLDVYGYAQIIGNLGVQTAPNTRTIQVGSTQGALIGIGTSEYIQDIGSYTLGFGAHLVPDGDGYYQLGSSTLRWNQVWAMDGTINTSDARDKSNIRDLNYGLKEIMQLRPIKFNWKSNPADGDKLGVVAQEIKKVLPEVVRDWEYKTDEQTGKRIKVPSAKLGVMYADIIPVLIHGMQEQQKQIDDLKQLVNQLTNVQTAAVTSTSNVTVSAATLEQNIPNPVRNTTTIRYNVDARNAQLNITNGNGKILKQIQLNPKGAGTVNVDCSTLTAGTYYYSLIVDNKSIDSKKMIVIK
jgi:hypothetical protein